MEEGSGAERVEIELTSRDDRRHSRRGRRHTTDVLDPARGAAVTPTWASDVELSPVDRPDADLAPPLPDRAAFCPVCNTVRASASSERTLGDRLGLILIGLLIVGGVVTVIVKTLLDARQ